MIKKMKQGSRVIISLILLLFMSCNLEQPVEVIEIEAAVNQPEETAAKKYSVSFSLEKKRTEVQADNTQTGNDARAVTEPNVPYSYSSIKYILLTIQDSEGKKIVNRKKTNKINWAPGFVLSEPLELPAGSYTLEEFVLLDNYDNVLYATPRKTNIATNEDTVLAKFVENPLPISFNVLDQENLVYTQVIDVNNEEDFAKNPGLFFGYDLGILDEVEVIMMDFTITPVGNSSIDGSITITYGDNKSISEEITDNTKRICLPKVTGDYHIRITNSDGSICEESVNYNFIKNSGYQMTLSLYYVINAVFLVKDENGDNMNNAWATIEDIDLDYPGQPLERRSVSLLNDNSPVEIILRSVSLDYFRIGMLGYQVFNAQYTIAQLIDSVNNPITISLLPNTVSFPLLIEKTSGLNITAVDVNVSSAAGTKSFKDLQLDTIHTIDVSRVSGYINVDVIKENIYPAQITQSMYFNDSGSNPTVTLVVYPDTAPIIDNFENSENFWIPSGRFVKRYHDDDDQYMSLDYYYSGQNAILTSSEMIDFDKNSNMILTLNTDMFDNYSDTFIQQYNNGAWENVAPIHSRDQGASSYSTYREINLNYLTGTKKLRIMATIHTQFLNSQSGIDDIQLISKEYLQEQFQVVLKSSGQTTSGQLNINSVDDLSIDLAADINTIDFMPQGNIVKITYTNAYGSINEEYDLDYLQNLTAPLEIIMPDIPAPPTPPPILMEEGFEAGLGEWAQATDDNFNWTRYSGSTGSTGTGPTSASEGTYYLYMEASGSNYPSKTASIISPYFNFDNQAGEYINMKLHMYGAAMGTFSIYYQNSGSSTWNLINSLSGNQGNSWMDFDNSLSNITGTARIKITGVTGSDFTSDFSIDDIRIGYTP